MKTPASYLDLLEGTWARKRIEEIKKGNIAAEMQVWNRHNNGVELNFYSKDLLTNKRNLTLLSLQDVVDSARNLRDRMQRGEWDEEFKLDPDNTVNTYGKIM